MRVAITGTTGRVGAALAHHLSRRHQVIPLPRQAFDLADPDTMRETLGRLECDAFFNPAGLTGLEDCEDSPALAHRLNTEAPGELAAWAAAHGVKFIHFSTDYVFSGESPGLHAEEEAPRPLSIYGLTKLAGEQAVLLHHPACVVRVSWVFGPEKPSFIDQVIGKALAGEPLSAVVDKFSLPTHTADLAGWMDVLLERDPTGLIHVCQSGHPVSWHGMAEVIVDELFRMGKLEELPPVRATRLDEMTGFRARRPRHTAMATNRLNALLDHDPRSWQDALRSHVRESR